MGKNITMIRCNLRTVVEDALRDTPVVWINGARQTGKARLVRAIADEMEKATYVTLDDAGALASAHGGPGCRYDSALRI